MIRQRLIAQDVSIDEAITEFRSPEDLALEIGENLIERQKRILNVEPSAYIYKELKGYDKVYRTKKLKLLKQETLKRLPNQIYQVVKGIPFRQGYHTGKKTAWYDIGQRVMFITKGALSGENPVTAYYRILGHEYWHAYVNNDESGKAQEFRATMLYVINNYLEYEEFGDRVKKQLRPYDRPRIRNYEVYYYLGKSLCKQLSEKNLTLQSLDEMLANSLGNLVAGTKGDYPVLENFIFEKLARKSKDRGRPKRQRHLVDKDKLPLLIKTKLLYPQSQRQIDPINKESWQSYQPEYLYPIEEDISKVKNEPIPGGPIDDDAKTRCQIYELLRKKIIKPFVPPSNILPEELKYARMGE